MGRSWLQRKIQSGGLFRVFPNDLPFLSFFRTGHRSMAGMRQELSIRRRRPAFECLEGRCLPATFTVVNTDDAGEGSLREAILDANATAAFDTIVFDIEGGTNHTIALSSALPSMTQPVGLDGWSQGGAGYRGPPLITLDGSALTATAVGGLLIGAAGSWVRGLVIQDFADLADTPNEAGYIGLTINANDVWVYGNTFTRNEYAGLAVGTGSISGALVGTNADGIDDAAERNLFIGNHGFGVQINGAGTVLAGNYFGVAADGVTAAPNGRTNLVVVNTSGNTIGGLTPAARNVISGDGTTGGAGILVTTIGNAVSTGNWIVGNFIGTNAAGTAALPNTTDGIQVTGGARDNLIGGTSPDARNVIAGNRESGILLATTGNRVEGNFIGLGADGLTLLGNGRRGIRVQAANNTIGGTSPAAGNTIAGNGFGTGSGTTAGILVENSSTTGVRILGNSISRNNGLGIDLNPAGSTPNDTGDGDTGPNQLQNFPVLTGATTLNGTVQITGTLNSTASTTFRLEFFSSDPASSSNADEGQVFLGAGLVTTNASGNTSFTVTFPVNNVATHAYITATATDPLGNTSEFSASIRQNNAPVPVNDFYSLNEDGTLVVAAALGVRANDSDPDLDPLTLSLATSPSHAAAFNFNSADGSFTYTPVANYSGADSFTYTVNDGWGGIRTATVALVINAVNDAPAATADYYDLTEDASAVVSAALGLLANDTDVDGPTLTAALLGGPANGTAIVNPDGSFTYTPAANFFGSDSFTYLVSDGAGGTVVGAAHFTVTPVNDPPSFLATNPPVVNEDAGAITVNGWAVFQPGASNESDQAATYLVSDVSNPALFSVGPSVTASGMLTYFLAPNASGSSTFDVVVQDNGGTADGGIDTSLSQQFTITVNPVNDRPSFTASDPAAIEEDSGPQTVVGWATFDAGASDESSQTATYTVLAVGNASLFAVLPSVAPDGTLTYTPAADASGTSTFTVQVRDSGGIAHGGNDISVAQTFTITVTMADGVPATTPAAQLEPDPLFPGKLMLVVTGTSGDDTITIKPFGNSKTRFRVTLNSTGPTLLFENVTGRIQVFGLDGNDTIILTNGVRKQTVLDGGAGDDLLFGSGGKDFLTGGAGNDTLSGRRGSDRLVEAGDVDMTLTQGTARRHGTLTGGLGNDVLIRNTIESAHLTGGPSANELNTATFSGTVILFGLGGDDTLLGGSRHDILVGGAGDDNLTGGANRDLLSGGLGLDVLDGSDAADILLGGSSAHEDDLAALEAVLREWASAARYAVRVGHLLGTVPNSRSGLVRLNDTKVFDDGLENTLTGGAQRDWFFAGAADQVMDADPGGPETVTPLS
jgi:hypothetical protein